MPEEKPPSRVDQFILEQIETVPHLEALLLVWRRRPKLWSIDEMATELYVPHEHAGRILRELAARGFLLETAQSPSQYKYASSEEQDKMITQVEATYRHELIRISHMIHSKAPSALRDFARAFRFTREREKEKE